MNQSHPIDSMEQARPVRVWKRLAGWIGVLIGLVVLLLAGVLWVMRPAPPVQLKLGDGRILQIEGVTYGTEHQIGSDSMLARFRPWLPGALVRHLSLDRRANRIGMHRPGLVVWVNAIHAAGGTNVDCQGIRVEFLDQNGDLHGETTRSWFGGQNFWRVGHVFECYPREEAELTLRVTTWSGKQTSVAKLKNPRVVQPSQWAGGPLPQSKSVSGFELRLANLMVRTNGQGQKAYYETAARYFEPVVKIFQQGNPVGGWSQPEWLAETPNGNHGQFLGVHQPALRFVTTIYPEVTNSSATQLIATLPRADLSTLTSNTWWNSTNSFGSNAAVILGLFPPGTHTFSDGAHVRSSATVNGPRGGAASGWTWTSRQATPFRVVTEHNHFTPAPVIYVKVGDRQSGDLHTRNISDSPVERLAIRLRDEHGGVWEASAEPASGGIQPYLVELPPNVTNVVPELVWLKPLQAEFLVNTKNIAVP